jgi:para-aminobenzoate synthetase component I
MKFADKLQTSQIFAHFAEQPWAFWLDSCDSSHDDCQYDIMVWQPVVTLTTNDKITKINYFDSKGQLTKQEKSNADPLLLVKNAQARIFPQPLTKSELPFIGGALGYFSYDLGRRFEQLPELAKQDIELPEMAVGIYLRAIIIDHSNKQRYLVCPDTETNALITQFKKFNTSKVNSKHINNSVNENINKNFKINGEWRSNISKTAYQEKFKQVQNYLLSGDCYQINLAQRFVANYQGDEFQAYLALRKANNAPFSAFMRFENLAILSISPERFLQVNANNKVQSKPIKGTRPRNIDKKLDEANAIELKKSAKDQAENLMIVDLLRNDISKSCVAGSVKVPKLFDIESFAAVHHLVSTVEAQLAPNQDASDLLRGAFPGGSITGAPKIRAMEIIEQLEPHRRSIYCGSIGYLSACGKMDTSITIRTLVCQKAKAPQQHKIYCWAGGGLVADSTVTSEYQETFDKVAKILPILSNL